MQLGIVFIEQERLLAHGEQVGSEAKLEFPQQLLKCQLSDTDVGLCQFYFGLALSTQYDELLQLKRFLTGSSNVKGSFIDGVVGIDIGNQYRIWVDRKSTRLNSSHVKISYAVFCLK